MDWDTQRHFDRHGFIIEGGNVLAASFLAIFVFKVAFACIVLRAGLLDCVGGKLMPDKFRLGGDHGASKKQYSLVLID